MRDSAFLVLAMGSNILGLAWIALAIDVHWRQVYGSRVLSRSRAVALRTLGAIALTTSLLLCLAVDHVSMASLVWIMCLAASAILVALVLAWRPSVVRSLVPRWM